MKKSVATIGILAILGAAWTGAAWFTGKYAEDHYQFEIQRSNQELAKRYNNSNTKVQVENVQFKRGLFSSEITYDLSLQLQGKSYILPFTSKLYHGPITLNQFSVAMFSVEGEMVRNEHTQPWFKDNQTNPAKYNWLVGYDKSSTALLTSDVVMQTSTHHINWSAQGEFNGKIGENFGKINLTIPTYQVTQKENTELPGKPSQTVTLNQLKIQSDIIPIADFQHLFNGTTKISVDKVSVKEQLQGQDETHFNIEGLSIGFNIKQQNEFVDVDVDYQINNFMGFGGLDLKLQFDHMDGKSLDTILVEANQSINKGIPPFDTPTIKQAALNLINQQPHFKVTPLTFKNAKGGVTVNLNVAPVKDAETIAIDQKTVLGLFKEFSLNVDVDKSAILEWRTLLLKEMFPLDPPEILQAKAEEEFNHWLDLIRESRSWKETENKFTINMALDNNRLKYNELSLSDQEVQMMLFGFLWYYLPQ